MNLLKEELLLILYIFKPVVPSLNMVGLSVETRILVDMNGVWTPTIQ